MESLATPHINCFASLLPNANDVVYLLSPIEVDNDSISEMAHKHGCNIAVLYGMNWNDDMSPWPAFCHGVGSFNGGADAFLETLKTEIIPAIERAIGYKKAPARTIAGVSLSGLFAIYAWLKDDYFSNMISISGSLWYPGLEEWLQERPSIRKDGVAFLSLGANEPKSKNASFAQVGVSTTQTIDFLRQHGANVTFEWSNGGHHAPLLPQLDFAIGNILA